MDNHLVEYLLGALEEGPCRHLEERLRHDTPLRVQLDLLRRALQPLEADKESPPPPPNLVADTIALVAEHMCRPLPKAPATLRVVAAPERPWWRRADVLLAASLFIAAAGIAAPLLLHSHRARSQTAQCQENLRTFAAALDSFHQTKGEYPHVAGAKPNQAAGLVVPMLYQFGSLPKDKPLVCPGIRDLKPADFSLEALQRMDPDAFAQNAPTLLPGYAYDLGFRDGIGYHPRPRVEAGLRSLMPLMADALPCATDAENSPNHGGRGQNVLFQDGHVKFVKSRHIGFDGDDIYLNKQNHVAAGLDPLDTVLGCASAKP